MNPKTERDPSMLQSWPIFQPRAPRPAKTVISRQMLHPSEATTSAEQAQLLVFGDSDFASNNYFNLQGNSDFFLNSINFLAQQENLISIERPKTAGTPFFLSPSQERLLFWVGLLLMPMVVLASGIAVFRLRRKHR